MAAPKTRNKTISYRRAMWLGPVGDVPHSLETYIRDAHAKLATAAQRKFKRGDGQIIRGMRYKPEKAGGVYLHVATETPGGHASTLPIDDEKSDGFDVSTSPPPRNRNFMDGDTFCFVRGNDMCICSTILRDGAIHTYLIELFRKAKLDGAATMFGLEKVANVDKLKMVKTEGVKEVDIRATVFSATTKYLERKNGVRGALGAVGRHLSALFIDNGKVEEDNVSVTVSFVANQNAKHGKALGSERLEDFANELLADGGGADDFCIVTKKNQRIGPNEVFVRELVPVERQGHSVNRDKAWAVLADYHARLVKSGVVAQ